MIGTFEYRLNCSLIHFIPQGETAGGYPVIVFPEKPEKVVPGKQYCFIPRLTRSATYVVDGIVYRVAHATNVIDTAFKEGTFLDEVIHNKAGQPASGALSERLNPEVIAALRKATTR